MHSMVAQGERRDHGGRRALQTIRQMRKGPSSGLEFLEGVQTVIEDGFGISELHCLRSRQVAVQFLHQGSKRRPSELAPDVRHGKSHLPSVPIDRAPGHQCTSFESIDYRRHGWLIQVQFGAEPSHGEHFAVAGCVQNFSECAQVRRMKIEF